MSDPKPISPLLDGFAMGNPISEHDGVRCCPAIKENTDNKYMVKIISIPAAQAQMDALLLAGAYKDPADAMDYYKVVAEDVVKEAELLKKLAGQEGFLSYDNWQVVPITRKRLGYEVYLVGSYKRSLGKYVRSNPVTHLEAINLGIDLCHALSICRKAGAMYVDLKPENIFMSDKKEYRIGDLGFIDLSALSYCVLPDKYRSCYTPPELFDPMSAMNTTVDTYGVGMILYQLFNEGQLPFRDKAPEEPLPSPVNADYELAEIIMKAIHPDPAQRWEDPKDMEHALVSYMQRNTVNDTPITPYIPLEQPEKEEIASEEHSDSDPGETVPAEQASAEPISECSEEAEATNSEEAPSENHTADDDTAPSESDADAMLPHEMSDELTKIIVKADDLIAHETPEGVIVPEAPELPDPFDFVARDPEDIDDSDIPRDPVMKEEPEETPQPAKKKNKKRFISPESKRRVRRFFGAIVLLVLFALLGCGAFWYYQNCYLQTIDSLMIQGDREQLTVTIDTKADQALLSVTCSDSYGTIQTKTFQDGTATFTDLVPNTMYKIQLEIEGFHALEGQTSDIFTTDTTTSILSFTAVNGPKDGSVQLNFVADGDKPRHWTVVYGTEGEEERTKTFDGYTIDLDDLSIGKLYTFTLTAGNGLSLSGETSVQFLSSRLILAEDITFNSISGSDMTVHWSAPGDILVDSWNVRCYNNNGYEEKLTVTDTEVYLANIDPAFSYIVEITASGMTKPSRASVTANPISITGLNVDESDAGKLTVSWEFTGNEPDGGWLLMYNIDGSAPSVVKCSEPSAVIEPRIPGANYHLILQAADGTSLFGNVLNYDCAEAKSFDENGLSAQNITCQLVQTPDTPKWNFEKLGADAVREEFAVGEPISAVLHGGNDFYLPGSPVEILYIIKDEHGNVLPELTSASSGYWKKLWNSGDYHYAELNLPVIPDTPGNYVLHIYFNNAAVAQASFTITE